MHQVRGQNKNSQEASHTAPWSCSSVQPQGTQQGALGISPCPTSSLNKNSKASSHFPSCTGLNSPENRPSLRVTEGIPTPHNYANAAKHIRATGLPQGQLCCWSPPRSSCLWFPMWFPGLQGNNTVPTGHGQSQGTIINGNRNRLIVPDLSTVTVLAS